LNIPSNMGSTWNISHERQLSGVLINPVNGHGNHGTYPMGYMLQQNNGDVHSNQQQFQISSQLPLNNPPGNPLPGNKFPSRPWHQPAHQTIRVSMVDEIIKLLRTRRPNANEDWQEKLPHMAKRLEDALYHDAKALEDYSDHNTLKQRLQQLALSMSGSNKQNKGYVNTQQVDYRNQPNSSYMRQNQPSVGNTVSGGGVTGPQSAPQYQQQARTAQAAASQYPQLQQAGQAGIASGQIPLLSSQQQYNNVYASGSGNEQNYSLQMPNTSVITNHNTPYIHGGQNQSVVQQQHQIQHNSHRIFPPSVPNFYISGEDMQQPLSNFPNHGTS
jgi:hypothetical protein